MSDLKQNKEYDKAFIFNDIAQIVSKICSISRRPINLSHKKESSPALNQERLPTYFYRF